MPPSILQRQDCLLAARAPGFRGAAWGAGGLATGTACSIHASVPEHPQADDDIREGSPWVMKSTRFDKTWMPDPSNPPPLTTKWHLRSLSNMAKQHGATHGTARSPKS